MDRRGNVELPMHGVMGWVFVVIVALVVFYVVMQILKKL